MFKLEYNEVLSILSSMDRTLEEIEPIIDTFSDATFRYNLTMQDAIAQEATEIVNSLRQQIEQMRELIIISSKKVHEGTSGLKQIEDRGIRL